LATAQYIHLTLSHPAENRQDYSALPVPHPFGARIYRCG